MVSAEPETTPRLVRLAESALSPNVDMNAWRANSILPSTWPSGLTDVTTRRASPMPGTCPCQSPTNPAPGCCASAASGNDRMDARTKTLRVSIPTLSCCGLQPHPTRPVPPQQARRCSESVKSGDCSGMKRRSLVGILGAGIASATVGGCGAPARLAALPEKLGDHGRFAGMPDDCRVVLDGSNDRLFGRIAFAALRREMAYAQRSGGV